MSRELTISKNGVDIQYYCGSTMMCEYFFKFVGCADDNCSMVIEKSHFLGAVEYFNEEKNYLLETISNYDEALKYCTKLDEILEVIHTKAECKESIAEFDQAIHDCNFIIYSFMDDTDVFKLHFSY